MIAETELFDCPLTTLSEVSVELVGSESESKKKQAGYIIATTALMLVPLMIFAAFATDVGAWYVRSQQIQRTVDAAALTGVVWMPNLETAEQYALETIRINGYPTATLVDRATFDAATGPTTDPMVVVERVGDQQVRVDLRANGEVYFGGLVADFADGVGINRFAVAEYVLPVEFGSPSNFLGFGTQVLEDGVTRVNAWTGLMGYCQPAHYGDVRAAYYYDNRGCEKSNGGSMNWTDLKATAPNDMSAPVPFNNSLTPTNPLHSPEGYYFVIDVPQGRSTGTQVMLFDAGLCSNSSGKPGNDTADTWLTYTLWDGTDTPLDDSDLINPQVFRPEGDTSDCNDWMNPSGGGIDWTIPVDVVSGVDQNAGRWFVQVQNDENRYAGFGRGVNYFSVSAWDAGATTPTTCYTYSSATCVGVYARDQLPIRTQTTGDSATFFLANVEPIHDGKQLEVRMWDLGEGMDYVQFLDPNGDPAPFTWTTDDPVGTAPVEISGSVPGDEDCTGRTSTAALGIDGTHCLEVHQDGVVGKSGTDWSNHGRFNGRWVTAVIELDDADYFTGSDFWWKVRYVKETGQNSADWTTWEVRVIGDPVRLVD